MTNQKTRSLTLASDPVARMRELHDLDAPYEANAASLERSNVETQQRPIAPSTERDGERPSERMSFSSNEPVIEQPHKRAGASSKQRRSDDSDPVQEAMKQALRQRYTTDLENGPLVSSTIRMPSEVWERLDLAARLQGQTKQAIIIEALKPYLSKIGHLK